MNFDKLCNIVLTESKKKEDKFDNLIVGNADPVFTPEDILRDPSDPSKGTKLYLGAKEAQVKNIDPTGPEAIRRQLRRVNWVTRKLVKKYQNRQNGVSIENLSRDIGEMLERYQTTVLGWKKPDKANTGYEVRVIGNILLPPTKRYPQGKSVFMLPGMDPDAKPEDGDKPVSSKKTKAKSTKSGSYSKKSKSTPYVSHRPQVTAEDIQKRFEYIAAHQEAFFDVGLRNTIKDLALHGTTMGVILSHPEIEDIFDANSVREVVKALIKSDVLSKDDTGTISLLPEEDWYSTKMHKSLEDSSSEEFTPVMDDEAEDEVDYSDDKGFSPDVNEDEEAVKDYNPVGYVPAWDKSEPVDDDDEDEEDDEDEDDEYGIVMKRYRLGS